MATGNNNNSRDSRNRQTPNYNASDGIGRGPPPGFNPRQNSGHEHRELDRRSLDPWGMFEELFRTGPPDANHRFPMYPFSPFQLAMDDDDFFRRGEMMSPMLHEFVAASPMFFGNRQFAGALSGEDRSLTDAEFQTVMSRLKKEKYKPKKHPGNGKSKGTQDEDHVCPICLDGFAAKQELLCLPCSHRFHSGCLTPWIKSHGQCPVCRLDLTGRARSRGNSTDPYSASSDASTNDMASFVRAVEEAFGRMPTNPQWFEGTHQTW